MKIPFVIYFLVFFSFLSIEVKANEKCIINPLATPNLGPHQLYDFQNDSLDYWVKQKSPKKKKSTFLELNHPMENTGMFCVLFMVLGILQVYDEGNYAGCKVDFGKNGLYYDPAYGPNWLQYYFEPINIGYPVNGQVHKIFGAELGYIFNLTEYDTSREKAFYLIQKYMHLKPTVQEKLNTFLSTCFSDNYIIGVHYRGTDKKKEAPRVPYENVIGEILKITENLKSDKYKVFVATDEQAFLDYMYSILPGKISFLDNAIRSKDGSPIHLNGSNNYQKGEEALLDCLILSKCNILIRTSSNLSLFSTFFNPFVPVINLNSRLLDAQGKPIY